MKKIPFSAIEFDKQLHLHEVDQHTKEVLRTHACRLNSWWSDLLAIRTESDGGYFLTEYNYDHIDSQFCARYKL